MNARFNFGVPRAASLRAGWILSPLLALICAASSPAMSRDLGMEARAALDHGRADDALHLLDDALQQDASDAEALNLRCRVFYAEHRWDDAIAACRHAVQLAPGNSDYHMWLGRAYGEKADRVSFVTAYKLAKQLRDEFEESATLDPKNGEDLSDLGEFYVSAPAIVGGGLDKAEALAAQLDSFSPERAHQLRARIAEAKKDYPTAEKEFRAKISAAAHASPQDSAQAWMDLGNFYRRRERWDDMLTALQNGAAASTDHGPALFHGADTLMHAKREPELAEAWMQQYLNGSALSEEAPAFVAHAWLAYLYQQQGDARRAAAELAAARSLASQFKGAQAGKMDAGRTNTDR